MHPTKRESRRGGGNSSATMHLDRVWGGELLQKTPSLHFGGGEPHLTPPYIGNFNTKPPRLLNINSGTVPKHQHSPFWNGLHNWNLTLPNMVHILFTLFCILYYFIPNCLPLILGGVNILFLLNNNNSKIKNSYKALCAGSLASIH